MINTTQSRCTIGVLGMLLPLIVLLLSFCHGYGLPDSISATWYLQQCVTPFMIILGSAGLFLFSYKGYDKQDSIVCSLAGFFGLMICLFPCGIGKIVIDPVMFENYFGGIAPLTVGTFGLTPEISGLIHNVSAVAFFLLLAYNSLFLFTKSSGNMTENKKKRNLIYRVCGVGMVASFLLLIPLNLFEIWGGTWLVEAIALAFFGISWLTKADCIPFLFCDKK